MAKKIFDILPPNPLKEEEWKEEEIKEQFSDRRRRKKVSASKLHPSARKRQWWKPVVLVLLLLVIFFYFTPPYLWGGANIEIWPETETVTFDAKLVVDEKAETVSFANNLIPGISLKEEKTFSQEFQATGKKTTEERSSGVIRVFNDSSNDQVLVANTRFQPPLEKFQAPLNDDEDPWFLTVERIVVPAKGYKDVNVVAAAPGEKYNIEPSTFSVPGLVGTPQYTFVYGKSSEPMKGGVKKEVPQVSQDDLRRAEESLKERAANEIKDILKQKIPQGFIILDDAIKTEILATSSLAKLGTEVEKFTFQVTAQAKTISFKQEDLESFSRQFILSKSSEDKTIDQKSLKIDKLPDNINLESGKLTLTLKLEAKIYSAAIDETSLKKALSDKSLDEAQFFLKNQPEITKAEVKLWPFWINKTPSDIDKIELRITID